MNITLDIREISKLVPTLWKNIYLTQNRDCILYNVEGNIFRKVYSGLRILTSDDASVKA